MVRLPTPDFLRLMFLPVLLAGLGCGDGDSTGGRKESAPVRPSIVLISIDTLRSDRLPAYGYDGVDTPAIDTLAADGILFERAYSHVPLTMPAHASLFTGLLPPEHGVRDNLGYRLAPELPYLPKLLQQEGYTTGGAVSAFVLRGQDGFAKGFDFYEDQIEAPARAGLGGMQRPGPETLSLVLPWLQEVAERPFFLFFHLFEPHTPYAPPEPFRSRYADPYDGEIAAADAVVGALLAELRRLGLYEDSIILLLSDHGEGLGDHGEAEHGLLLYRESLQIPLLLKLPNQEMAGQRISVQAQLVDVFPTLAELAGLPRHEELPGTSLLDLAQEGAPNRPVYAETFFPRLHFGWSELRAWIEEPFHYIDGPDPELYDVGSDPEQRRNILTQQRREAARLRQALARVDVAFAAPEEVDIATRDALASLGYVGSANAGSAGESLPDPKSRLGTLEDLKEGLRAYQEGRFDDAARLYTKAVEANPASLDAWEYLGRSWSQLGRLEEATQAIRKALDLGGGSHLALAAGRMLLDLRRPEEALELLRKRAETDPAEPRLRLLEAQTLLLLGRLDEAWGTADRLLRSAPDYADAHYLRGSIDIGRQRFAKAEEDLRQALELAPEHTGALADLAMLRQHLGDREEARLLFERILELRPGDGTALRGLEALGTGGGGTP